MAIRVRRMPTLKGPSALADAKERRRALELILRERRRLLAAAIAVRDVNSDPVDVARDLEEEQVWLAVLDQSREMQRQIDEAMLRLTDGRYGRCLDCAKPIPAGRLRALPFALRCLACQEKCERRKAPLDLQTAPWGGILWSEESDGADES